MVRYVLDCLWTLTDRATELSYHHLMQLLACVTLAIAVILMLSGRKSG